MESKPIQGTAVSPGLAAGPVHVVHAGPTDIPAWTVGHEEVPLEIGRLASALNIASEKLLRRQEFVAEASGAKDAEIFAVHRMILQDPNAMREVERTISEQRINAEAAVQLLIRRFEMTMGGLEGNNVRGFASDVTDPWRFVLDALLERDREEVQQASEPVLLAAAELTPKVVTYLERSLVLGVVAESGGRFSHGAVLVRSLGVPCVVGVPNLLPRLEQGMRVLLDGDHGEVTLRPSDAQTTTFLERQRLQDGRRVILDREAGESASTPDGGELQVRVNIESVRDLDTFELGHSDGVGLFRTEFLYMEKNEFPSEEEQYRLYRLVLERMGGRPTTIRLLDIGGDKPLPYFKTPPETNPALGWRGIRVTMQWRDLMRVQLRALLRASTVGNLRVLVPMITSLEEVQELRSLFDEVRAELERQGYDTSADVPVGAMVEVPSTLFLMEDIAELVDFVSVGTNDLVQYLLAVDRDNAWVSHLYDPQHPCVLRALNRIAGVCKTHGVPASVCGDAAADPAMSLVLLGMGFEAVSVAPQFLAEIKYAVRRTSLEHARQVVDEVIAEGTAEGVRTRLEALRSTLYEESDGAEEVQERA